MTTIEDLIALINRTQPDDIQSLFEKSWEGTCPCFWGSRLVSGHRLYIHGRCWRVSVVGNQDLHVWGIFAKNDLRRVGEALKRKLDAQKWYNPYTIILGKLGSRPIKRRR